MREPIVVANLTFKTKKALNEYTEKLIEKKNICSFDKTDSDFGFFNSLYFRKPSNVNKKIQICKFNISLDPIKKQKANHLSYIDTDNNETVFSWRKCCDAHDSTLSENLKQACRECITDQITLYKNKNTACVKCGKIKTHDFEVDHVIEFSELYNTFISTTPLYIPTNFESNSKTQQTKFTTEDVNFKQTFQNFHLDNAVLQLLCNSCHQYKTTIFNSISNSI